MSNLISPAGAHEFYNNGLAQLDHLLIGEHEAKVGMLIAMASGLNVVFVGEPGGGKTTLAANAHRIIEGIHDDDLAIVPPQSDLMPQQLIGGTTEFSKTTESMGVSSTETTQTKVDAIVKPTTKVIFANEINRINPYAVNGILEALESGLLVTTAGTSRLNDLEYGVSTMNPSETRQGTFPMAAATASRHAIGAVLGGERTERRHLISTVLDGRGNPEPDKVEAVIDLSSLHALRERAREGTVVPGNLLGDATEIVERVVDGLKKHNIGEADGRIAKQIGTIARTHAVLQGQEAVDKADVQHAARYVLMARLGILDGRGSISDVVAEILN